MLLYNKKDKDVSMKKQDKETIIKIIKQLLPQSNIYLFGSRARKDNQPESDIDIAIDNNQKIDLYDLSIIKENIEESTIPFTVDIVDLNAVSDDLKKQILKDGILWL